MLARKTETNGRYARIKSVLGGSDTEREGRTDSMRRMRIEQKARRTREERPFALPLDPRDPEILRAKRMSGEVAKSRRF